MVTRFDLIDVKFALGIKNIYLGFYPYTPMQAAPMCVTTVYSKDIFLKPCIKVLFVSAVFLCFMKYFILISRKEIQMYLTATFLVFS